MEGWLMTTGIPSFRLAVKQYSINSPFTCVV
jgi:hypothetical protein